MKLITEARIVSGKMELKKRSVFIADLSMLRDGDYIVTIECKTKRRSLMQNKYYWGCVVPLVKQGLIDAGYRMTTEGTHEFLKANFNLIEIVNESNGEILKSIGSTTEMTTTKMMEYFSKITEWAEEYLNIQIPAPNEQLKIEV
jgi:hypothetical protein